MAAGMNGTAPNRTPATPPRIAAVIDFLAAARTKSDVETRLQTAAETMRASLEQAAGVGSLAAEHLRNRLETRERTARDLEETLRATVARWPSPAEAAKDWAEYLTDAGQRMGLFLDVMRTRGNTFLEHEAQGQPPVLDYAFDVIVDGRTMDRPVNYALVQIRPPEGVAVDLTARPFIIIDPRAGHGAGIGGFKSDSQVGVALRAGHPVYFVIFFPQPEPGQTLADVCRAEGVFVREVSRRHPDAPRAAILGNCQGGWATMLLAASSPDVTGPVVINGAPMSYWAGARGTNPMRYLGGFTGGTLATLLLADLGGGKFDGANLVMNFESLNPSRTWWRKYYDVYAKVDTETERFLQFERWWSGFYFLNEQEIRWILNNLFVGNKLARGDAQLGAGRSVDLRAIRSPVIVFASHGDNITPPQQALNWIADAYADTDEIKVLGKRIVYTLHQDVGHLGIFVSGAIAKREHDRIVNVLQMVEALAPGLYEMVITDKVEADGTKRYSVAFEERKIEDILAHDDGRDDERAFATLAYFSDLWERTYEVTARPVVKAMATPASARALVRLHPMRVGYYGLSDLNPFAPMFEFWGKAARADRKPVAADNPFLQMERLWAAGVDAMLDASRDMRAMMLEVGFLSIYGQPALQRLGSIDAADAGDVEAPVSRRDLPEVRAVLANIARGGFAEAVIRMLILMARARGSVRRSRLERSNALLHSTEPFKSLGDDLRSRIINEQSLIIEMEPQQALETLPTLLAAPEDRKRALDVVEAIAGPVAEMDARTMGMFHDLHRVLSVALPGPEIVRTAPAAAE